MQKYTEEEWKIIWAVDRLEAQYWNLGEQVLSILSVEEFGSRVIEMTVDLLLSEAMGDEIIMDVIQKAIEKGIEDYRKGLRRDSPLTLNYCNPLKNKEKENE